CDFISQRTCAELWYRQAAGRDHQSRRPEFADFSWHDEPVPVLNFQRPRLGENLYSGNAAFGFQHSNDGLRRLVAEELPKLFLVVGNSVLLDEFDETRRHVPRQRRLAEVRISGEEVVGPAAQIGEIATPAAGDEDLFANAIGVLQHGDPAATLAGFEGTHQSGCAAAENNHVEGLVGQVMSFKSKLKLGGGKARRCCLPERRILKEEMANLRTRRSARA